MIYISFIEIHRDRYHLTTLLSIYFGEVNVAAQGILAQLSTLSFMIAHGYVFECTRSTFGYLKKCCFACEVEAMSFFFADLVLL